MKVAAVVAVIAVLAANYIYGIVRDPLLYTYTVHKEGIILVTGASSGIGRDAALRLASEGYTVFGSVRRAADGDDLVAEATHSWPAGTASRMHAIELDVAKPDQIAAALATIKAFMATSGLLFVGLVNNAGVGVLSPSELAPEQLILQTFQVNVFGLINTTQTFLPLLRASKGRVVQISSTSGTVSSPGMGVYAATKHAVEGYSGSLRQEMVHFGVAVIIVAPGPIRTKIPGKLSTAVDEVFSRLDQETLDAYDWMYRAFKMLPEKIEQFMRFALETSATSDAIVDAFTAAQPFPRVVVAHPLAKARNVLCTHVLATALCDYVSLKVYTE